MNGQKFWNFDIFLTLKKFMEHMRLVDRFAKWNLISRKLWNISNSKENYFRRPIPRGKARRRPTRLQIRAVALQREGFEFSYFLKTKRNIRNSPLFPQPHFTRSNSKRTMRTWSDCAISRLVWIICEFFFGYFLWDNQFSQICSFINSFAEGWNSWRCWKDPGWICEGTRLGKIKKF